MKDVLIGVVSGLAGVFTAVFVFFALLAFIKWNVIFWGMS